jgi:hypothetical protein
MVVPFLSSYIIAVEALGFLIAKRVSEGLALGIPLPELDVE